MKQRRIRASVVMACYNGATHVGEAVRSILDQTMSDLELIIIDDGSTDESLQILRQYEAQDDRVVVLGLSRNSGPAVARNAGVRAARGEWVAVLDADDVAAPSRLAEQLAVAGRHRDLVMVASDAMEIDEVGRILQEHRYPRSHSALVRRLHRVGPFPPHSSMTYLRAAVAAQYFNPRYVPSEDCDLWLRLSSLGRVTSVQAPLVKIRKHEMNLSNRDELRQPRLGRVAIICQHLRKNGFPDPSVHATDSEWDEFVTWVHARLEGAGVYRRHQTWQELRRRYLEEGYPTRILGLVATVAGSGHAGTLISERLFGSALPQRLASEWIARNEHRVTAGSRAGEAY